MVLPDEGNTPRWDSPVLPQQAGLLITENCSFCPVRINLRMAKFAVANLYFEAWLVEEIELSYITDNVSWLITVS